MRPTQSGTFKRWRRGIASIFFYMSVGLVFFSGCATHQGRLQQPLLQLRAGQFVDALAGLKKLSEENSGDQLLYMMEYGTALHIAGEFQESNRIFMAADKLADAVDYHSISRIAVATLGSEEMLQYKGESYEKLLINAYLALNFMMLGQHDSALVEVRRINDKIKKYRADGREDYEYNPFAIYLSALLYEADRQFDDAYIAFEKTYELDPTLPTLPEDLIRTARLARRSDALAKWRAQFPGVRDSSEKLDRSWGEIIVLYEQGWGPRKDYAYADHRYPRLVPQSSYTRAVKVTAEYTKPLEQAKGLKALARPTETQFSGQSEMVYDLENAAIRTLDADYKWMIARKVGAFVAKKAVAESLRQKDETLGLLADIVMQVSDRADLRNWTTLPQTIQVVRIPVPPGVYHMTLQGQGFGSEATADRREDVEVKVRPGQKIFYAWRSLR